tara:strand:- start:448 stop:618 length:171 start_codon:yes stop_codon:yes gene_type:complete
MTITSAQYMSQNNKNFSIKAVINGIEMVVPLDSFNRHYAEIMRQVKAGELTIADAD